MTFSHCDQAKNTIVIVASLVIGIPIQGKCYRFLFFELFLCVSYGFELPPKHQHNSTKFKKRWAPEERFLQQCLPKGLSSRTLILPGAGRLGRSPSFFGFLFFYIFWIMLVRLGSSKPCGTHKHNSKNSKTVPLLSLLGATKQATVQWKPWFVHFVTERKTQLSL